MAELLIAPHLRSPPPKLMRNCDLPPPSKLMLGCFDNPTYSPSSDDTHFVEKLDLLKAVQLSQTRAREAERKAEEAKSERDKVYRLLVGEAMKVLAYKRWILLLEIEVKKMKTDGIMVGKGQRRRKMVVDEVGGGGGVEKWKLGLAVCLGLAGLGLAYRYGLS